MTATLMAFVVPVHLPKRPTAVDVSSQILYKIDSATKATLNASLAQTWIRELDESIEQTKLRLYDRIQSALPELQQQLETSKLVHMRYETLATRLDDLNDILCNPKSGIFPTLINTLTEHSTLSQNTSDAETVYQALSYLLDCRNTYTFLTSCVQVGQLPEAVEAVDRFQSLIVGLPEPLGQTRVAEDMRRKLESTKARIQDQLSDAYSRSVIISPTELLIRPQVQVRLSESVIQLRALLHCLSPPSLTSHLSTFRRDLMNSFVDRVLGHAYTVAVQSSSHEMKLSLVLSSSQTEDPRKRLDNLSIIMNFLLEYLFPNLPSHEAQNFKRSLSKPVANNILNVLLVPSLPSSFGLLPSFLDVLKRSVSFEKDDIGRLLESGSNDGTIKAWADGISGHYERRRRVDILEETRHLILDVEDLNDTFQAFSQSGPESSLPCVIPVHDDFKDDDAWGLDEPSMAIPLEDEAGEWSGDVADNWGLDEGTGDESDMESTKVEDVAPAADAATEVDHPDIWGWDDDADVGADETYDSSVWDDPWADSGEIMSALLDNSPPQVTSVISSKAAPTKLEKLASKNRKQTNGHSSPSTASMVPLSSPPPIPSKKVPSPRLGARTQKLDKASKKRPTDVVTSFDPKEAYLVPKKTKRTIRMVETVIDESKLFSASNLFADKDIIPMPGSILSQTASSILDLYQALYPIKHGQQLEEPDRGMLFSNSCLYMATTIQRIEDTLYGQTALKKRLAECRYNLRVLSDSWFTETIERQQRAIEGLLDGAQGFAETTDQDRYDECETSVNDALQHIKRLAKQLKGILPKTKYYAAIGSIANAALSRMLHDVLALCDIPEVESHRLSELCHILNSVEGLFSEESEPSFVVVYVTNWLKFNYLSELMEASLADITYLFEQGALIDFQVEELVKLVRALFADSPLRTNTINKILNGIPHHHDS